MRFSILEKVNKYRGDKNGKVVLGASNNWILEKGFRPENYFNSLNDYKKDFRGNNFEKWNNKLKRLIQRRYDRKTKMRYLREMALINSDFLSNVEI